MARRKRLGEILVEACLISPAQLDEALHLQKGQNRRIGQILVDLGWVNEPEVCRAVAELLNIKYVDVADALISQEVVQLAPEDLAVKRNILPLFTEDKTLYLAMENPLDGDVIQRIEFRTGMQVRPLIAPPSQLRETVRKHYNVDAYLGQILGAAGEENAMSVEQATEAETDTETLDQGVDISEVKKASEGSQTVKLANLIIAEGIKKRASDIHIEPTAKQVMVRYRIDGLLTKGIQVPNWLKLSLISRLKVLSGMDIAERRKPQDGRIRVKYAQRQIDLRVSMLLTNFGEKVVIRILDSKTSAHDLTRLGFAPDQLKFFRAMLKQPQGWILVTGPTGSGKTTTLYAALNMLKDVTKNIVTVEDPIEYQLEGINQVQVNPKAGLTFASGLRSILRQDPNVILIGEIRDAETAGIAMQASETGHLVMSTLHTNDALATVNRLFNLGISADLVASNLLLVIAQRLVRRICPHCQSQYVPAAQELHSIGLANGQQPALAAYRGNGCAQCKQTGYAGQLGLYELFAPNDRLREAIARRPAKNVLKQLAAEAGMHTMLADGIEKIRQGITTIAEVARVCYVEPDESGKADESGKPAESGKPIEVADVAEPAAALVPIQANLQKRDIRIVAADDEAPIREMVKLLLENQGYHVIPAVDGEDALAKIRAELPDLVILDVMMPKHDGFAVCKAVRTSVETMFTPVIMLTGQDSIEEKLQGLSSGADDYITKPFHAGELVARIETVLRRSYQTRKA